MRGPPIALLAFCTRRAHQAAVRENTLSFPRTFGGGFRFGACCGVTTFSSVKLCGVLLDGRCDDGWMAHVSVKVILLYYVQSEMGLRALRDLPHLRTVVARTQTRAREDAKRSQGNLLRERGGAASFGALLLLLLLLRITDPGSCMTAAGCICVVWIGLDASAICSTSRVA